MAAEIEVAVESLPRAPFPEADLPLHEVVCRGPGGDYSWAAYMDPAVAGVERERLRTMLLIVLPPGEVTVAPAPAGSDGL